MEIVELGEKWEQDLKAIAKSKKHPLVKFCINLKCFDPKSRFKSKMVKFYVGSKMGVYNDKNKCVVDNVSLRIETRADRRCMNFVHVDEFENVTFPLSLKIEEKDGSKNATVVDDKSTYKFQIKDDKVCDFKKVKRSELAK